MLHHVLVRGKTEGKDLIEKLEGGREGEEERRKPQITNSVH
jgi:hypothetical protein